MKFSARTWALGTGFVGALGIQTLCAFGGFNGKPSLSYYESGFTSLLRGWPQQLYLKDERETFVTLGVVSFEYCRSFQAHKIARLLFGSDSITVSGSIVPDRNAEADVLADYLGLPRDFKSCLHFSPVVTDFTLYMQGFCSLDSVVPGLFVGAQVPLRNTKWLLKMHECVVDAGTAFHPAGYMGPERIERDKLAPDATTALLGEMSTAEPLAYGDMQNPLAYGQFVEWGQKFGLSDCSVMCGWLKRYYAAHVGCYAVTRIPVANRRTGRLYFEPVVGNGKHWELGGGLTWHYDFFRRESGECCGIYFDSLFSHIFPTEEKRCFALRDRGLGSKYTLLQEMSQGAYSGRLFPTINKTTLDAHIEVAFKADLTAKIVYTRNLIDLEFGYNLLANTHEKLKERACFAHDIYALKGDAQVYGFDSADNSIALHATQNAALPTAGQVPGNVSIVQFANETAFQNLNADNKKKTNRFPLDSADAADLGLPHNAVSHLVYTSQQPILLQDADIDSCSVLYPKAIAHKFFFQASKLFGVHEQTRVKPSLSAGFSVEIADTDPVKNAAISRWSINMGGSLYW